MKKYCKVDVSEQVLEDLVRQNAELIEEGLIYVDHQKHAAGGRLDVLLMDSGRALVVAELKVAQDDGMLLQGLDYYDYASMHVESYARLYKTYSVNPTQQVRLFLIAPSFSQTLVNRCKWLDLPVSLFTFSCLKFDGGTELTPIFMEQQIAEPPEPLDNTNPEDLFGYITDEAVRAQVTSLLDEIRSWKPGSISIDPTKYAFSLKVNGAVFAYLNPRRHHYLVQTFNANDEWTPYPIKSDDDLAKAKPLVRASLDRRTK